MKTTKEATLVCVAIFQGLSVCAGTANIEALVVDEVSGEPINDVEICGSFKIEGNPWDYVKGSPSPNLDCRKTDSNGRCKLKGDTNCGKVSCFLKSGPSMYYWMHRSEGHEFKSKNFFGVWQPDNLVVTIKLQRVEHPIPLIVKSVWGHDKEVFPKGKDVLMFDFFAGDWLPPTGKGKIADVKFTRLPTQSLGIGENDGLKAESYRDSMKVEFLGADNGILEVPSTPAAALKIRTAPESGYIPQYLCWKGRSLKLQRETNYDKNRCFCFRVRTRRDEKGRIEEAYYGKIYGDITFDFSVNPVVPVASVQMHYYLNPISLDRNLEWDRKTNLCPNPGDVGRSVGDRQP